MNCQQFRLQLNDYVDGELESHEHARMDHHATQCSDCAQHYHAHTELIHNIARLPVKRPPPGFHKRAMEFAQKPPSDYRQGFRYGVLTGAFATTVFVALSLWLLIPALLIPAIVPQSMSEPPAQLASLKLAIDEARVVQLIVDSPQDLHDATFALDLPTDITLSNVPELNLPGNRKVSWKVDLKKGKNRLQLPVHARGLQGGLVIAQLHHNNSKKIFIIDVKINSQKDSQEKT